MRVSVSVRFRVWVRGRVTFGYMTTVFVAEAFSINRCRVGEMNFCKILMSESLMSSAGSGPRMAVIRASILATESFWKRTFPVKSSAKTAP